MILGRKRELLLPGAGSYNRIGGRGVPLPGGVEEAS